MSLVEKQLREYFQASTVRREIVNQGERSIPPSERKRPMEGFSSSEEHTPKKKAKTAKPTTSTKKSKAARKLRYETSEEDSDPGLFAKPKAKKAEEEKTPDKTEKTADKREKTPKKTYHTRAAAAAAEKEKDKSPESRQSNDDESDEELRDGESEWSIHVSAFESPVEVVEL